MAKEGDCTGAKEVEVGNPREKMAKRATEHDLRKDRKRQRINTAGGTDGTAQVNPIDHHGKGVAKVKRKAKAVAKAAAKKAAQEEATAAAAAKASKPKGCAFYAVGFADSSKYGSGMGIEFVNRCDKGSDCPREHSAAVSKANIARWKTKAKNAAKAMSSMGGARVDPAAIRTGTIINFKPGRGHGTGFGHILPDANEIHSNRRKQWVFFHISNWTGKIDTIPTEENWQHMKVRYVRAVDQRSQGKWCAVRVSKR